ncbi:unnamed protein product [Cuscuta epithymum]|uniref:Uncharacterized protein n=1 Tax=Cuscuta epithymum TaxID=186058 RepID=A0AAV0DUZ0_9ASTE|nr:unnamed protein product [Cuscuta epithymum]
MMAAWGDSSDDEEEENDKNTNHAGLCLMALSDEESDQESFESALILKIDRNINPIVQRTKPGLDIILELVLLSTIRK